MTPNVTNIRKAAAFLRANGGSFNQGHPTTCTIGMVLQSTGRFPRGASANTNAERSRQFDAATEFLGIPRESVVNYFDGKFPAGLGPQRFGRGQSEAELAAQVLESHIPTASGVDTKVLALLVFAGKVSQADVDAARALLS